METEQVTISQSQLREKWDSLLAQYVADVNAVQFEYPEQESYTIEFNQIQLHDPELADELLVKPKPVLWTATTALWDLDSPLDPKPRLHFRVKGLPETVRVEPRKLRAEHLGKFLCVEGIVKRATEVMPKTQEACFQCKSCGNEEWLIQDDDRLSYPVACIACEKTGNIWKFIHEQSKYVDFQKLEIQESPEGLRGGEQAEKLVIHANHDLCQQVNPGDRVRINGTFTPVLKRRGNSEMTELNKVLIANSIEVMQQDFQEVTLSKDDVERIHTIASSPTLIDDFRQSFGPTIYGMDTEKDALILALFGGVPKERKDGSRNRGDIHVLLVGDPGVAKSQLIYYLSKLAPRAVFTSGKTSSAAGLTAAAVKDEFGEGGFTLEAGALVLADLGVACIDELDKMAKTDQNAMLQAMEQQEVSVAKAGISTSLKSRCTVIGAANPKLGRFDDYEPILGQINITPPLLSRFDLIFSIRDKPQKDKDAQLAQHILDTHHAGQLAEVRRRNNTEATAEEVALSGSIEPVIGAEEFRKYVAYAKKNIYPVFDAAGKQMLSDYFVKLRNENGDTVPFTARNLEAFVRLSEACARMRLSPKIEAQDVQRALGIAEEFLNRVGIDQGTGAFDIDVIATGVPKSQHDRVRGVQDILRDLVSSSDKGWVKTDEVADACKDELAMTQAEVEKTLETMRRNNSVYCKGGHGTWAPL